MEDGWRKIDEWPYHHRPRERLRHHGARALSVCDLLALVIETGNPATADHPARTPVDVADKLVRHLGGEDTALLWLREATVSTLCEIPDPALGPATAAKVLAAIELGRRAWRNEGASRDEPLEG